MNAKIFVVRIEEWINATWVCYGNILRFIL